MTSRPLNGTQKADVYSFAIILQEITYRAEPFFVDFDPPECTRRYYNFCLTRHTDVFYCMPKCQTPSKTQPDGQTVERTYAGNRILVHFALKCDIWWQYFYDFPDNQLTKFRVFIG